MVTIGGPNNSADRISSFRDCQLLIIGSPNISVIVEFHNDLSRNTANSSKRKMNAAISTLEVIKSLEPIVSPLLLYQF